MRAVISDASCLILYDKISELEILRGTFSSLIITPQVAKEFGDELPNWIRVKTIRDTGQYHELIQSLGRGEASSIVLAQEIRGSLLIIDEKRGRRVAKNLSIEIIGSLGILLKAKQKEVIKSVASMLEKIEQTNFRVSKVVKEELLKRANETMK
jgi:predicted nucleic acid-binding protein